MHFTNLLSEAGKLLHCLRNFLVLVAQFAEGCSYDVLPGLYMAVHARGYSVIKHEHFKGTLNLPAVS